MTATLERPLVTPSEEDVGEAPPRFPRVTLPRVPAANVLWRRGMLLLYVATGLIFLDRLTKLLMDYWFFQSLGFGQVFWTNFWTSAVLWIVGGGAFAAAIAVPAFAYRLPVVTRKRALQAGVLAGIIIGYHFSGDYRDYLTFLHGQAFGQQDPIFHHDIGFYVFKLPAIWTTLRYALWATAVALVSCVVCSWRSRPAEPPAEDMNPVARFVGTIGTTGTIWVLSVLTAGLAVQVFLSRYSLLVKSNSGIAIANGPGYLDVHGVVSNLNYIYLMVFVVIGRSAAAVFILRRLHRRVVSPDTIPRTGRTRRAIIILLALEALELFGFRTLLSIRNMTQVKPNEPAIQLPFIQHGIDATRQAWGLDQVQTGQFSPQGPTAPPPDVPTLVNSPTFQNGNTPLWPGFTSYLTRLIDAAHSTRFLSTLNPVVLSVTLDSFNQQQRLRGYYDFMGVDPVRYPINGEPHLLASSAREIPLVEPKPWLSFWGQRFLLFTHGHGLVMAPVGQKDTNGQPVYASSGIPIRTTDSSLTQAQPAIYYGEGSGSMAYSDVRNLPELNYATDEGRATIEYPKDVKAGVKMDTLLKRIVFGWRSRNFFEIVFSNLVTSNTRVHYYRTPMERVERVVPFLYFDTNPYAVAAQGRVMWMVNGIAATDRYPYSARGTLGDNSDERTTAPRPFQTANYVRDAAKATIDAYTGAVHFYAIDNDPIMRTWQKVYPSLFASKAAMPTTIRQQAMYPIHLFQAQFDQIYPTYHMTDALTFYNLEDAWQAGQQVMGPVLQNAGQQINFPIPPNYWIAGSGGLLPASSVDEQFVMSMVFTNRGDALNLRAIPMVYMSGSDYGKLSTLAVPKGTYSIGPGQADAALDQDSYISQQIGFWERRGIDAIRGQMSTLLVKGELIYVEPLFITSRQNPVPQLKRVLIVSRGKAAMGRTLPEALDLAVNNTTPSFGLGD